MKSLILCGLALSVAPLVATAEDISSDTVVARRGGVEITVADVDSKIRSIPLELRSGYLLEADRMSRLFDALLLTKQMAKEAEKQNLGDTPEFAADLELRRTELLSQQALESFMATISTVNLETLAKERYLANPEVFRPAPHIALRHILFGTEGKDEAAAKQGAEEFYKQLTAGRPFVQVAAEYVGELGDAVRSEQLVDPDTSRLDAQFVAAFSKLDKPGDFVGPVRSRYGYHVILLEAFDVRPIPPFEAVKDQLLKQLGDKRIAEQKTGYLRSFSQLNTDINPDAVKSLPLRYLPAEARDAEIARRAERAKPAQ